MPLSDFERLVAEGLRVRCHAAMHAPVPPGYSTGLRVLPFAVVAGLTAGQCRAEVAGRSPWTLRPGSMICARAGIRHRFSHPSPSVACSTHIDFRLFGSLDALALLDIPVPLPAACGAGIVSLIDGLVAAQRRGREPLRDLCALQASGFALLDRLVGACPVAPGAIKRLRAGQRLAPAIAALEADLSRIDLPALCRLTRLSRSRLHEVFTAAVGRSPMAHVRWRRLERAREQLATSTTPVAEVASCCGFPDPFNFSRAFKAAYGSSPSAFRAALAHALL
jgi:AraC-like DNA-binding protein